MIIIDLNHILDCIECLMRMLTQRLRIDLLDEITEIGNGRIA